MYCPSCAAENPDNARFCGDCGKEMPAVASADPTPTSAAKGTAPSVSDGLKFGILAATVIVPFVGIIMGLIYMFGGIEERKPVGKLWLGVGIVAMLFWIGMAGG